MKTYSLLRINLPMILGRENVNLHKIADGIAFCGLDRVGEARFPRRPYYTYLMYGTCARFATNGYSKSIIHPNPEANDY